MMNKIPSFFCLILSFGLYAGICHADDPTIIRMSPKQSEADVSHSYLVELLQSSLKMTAASYGPAKVEFMPISLNQGLILHLLDIDGVLDVVASAPTVEREQLFRSARVPLMMGLLGYRMMIIRPEDKATYDQISRPSQLKKLRACQAMHWPDADILERAGYRVVRGDTFEVLFELLQDNKCDYFPRAITEGYGEVLSYNVHNPNKKLTAFDKVLLHYEVPFYFFTSHKKFQLAARIEQGLDMMAESGQLLQHMQSHQVTKGAFPLSKWQGKTIFYVENEEQLDSTPLHKKHYWLKLPGRVITQ